MCAPILASVREPAKPHPNCLAGKCVSTTCLRAGVCDLQGLTFGTCKCGSTYVEGLPGDPIGGCLVCYELDALTRIEGGES